MDLNLLRAFVAVFETRSLTAAAERLFVTQPAVSQTLARLRDELDDQLFFRVGRGMRPTPLAETLYPEFKGALDRVDRAVDGVRGFSPATSERRFRIALSELGELGYLPAIASTLATFAPNAGLDVLPLDVELLPDWLSRGTVDLAVTSSSVLGDFESTPLRTQRYAVLMSAHNPLAASPELTLDAYLSADHVIVTTDSGASNVERALAQVGARRTRFNVNRFAALPALLSRTNMIATVPDNLMAGWFGTWPLVMRELPFEMEPIEIRVFVRATSQHTTALAWFRRMVVDVSRGVGVELFKIGWPEEDHDSV